MKKIAVLIDGGYLRVLARKAGKKYTADLIEKIGIASAGADEEIYRILYYDCAEFSGTAKLPVSGNIQTFTPRSTLLSEIARKQLFATRMGVLKFRGYKPINIPVAAGSLTDADFKPDFEQKGVDMRIGLDIALFSQTRVVERIVLVTNDTDTIPVMKYGRRAGLQVVLVEVDGCKLAPDLAPHTDFIRPVLWP